MTSTSVASWHWLMLDAHDLTVLATGEEPRSAAHGADSPTPRTPEVDEALLRFASEAVVLFRDQPLLVLAEPEVAQRNAAGREELVASGGNRVGAAVLGPRRRRLAVALVPRGTDLPPILATLRRAVEAGEPAT